MPLPKKEKLIHSLKVLDDARLNPLIRLLGKRDFSKEYDLNAMLTRIIYRDVISRYPEIMENPKSAELKKFCINDIGPIKSDIALKSTPKIRR